MKPLALCVLVILLWGVWGFLNHIGVKRLGVPTALVWASLAGIVVNVGMIAWCLQRANVKLEWSVPAGGLAAATVCAIAGTVAMFAAMRQQKGGVVVAMTAVYPVVTVLLNAAFLGERLRPVTLLGAALATAGGVLLSFEAE